MRELKLVIALTVTAWSTTAQAQGFDSGSDGSYGPIDITSHTQLPMPDDGVFHATTINVANAVTLSFIPNGRNTPVYLLATGDVVIDGTISVDGQLGTATAGGAGGPGGFAGGAPGFSGNPPGAGKGPGGGQIGAPPYTTRGAPASFVIGDNPYGTLLLVPLVGGSGAAGTAGLGGSGGGGAILIASNTKITFVSGTVSASAPWNSASYSTGGAIRVVAPEVEGTGTLSAIGYATGSSDGRVRIDSLFPGLLTGMTLTAAESTMGNFMLARMPDVPRMHFVSVAGQTDFTSPPVSVLLPYGSSPDQTITVETVNFMGAQTMEVVLTPDSGDPIVHQQAFTGNGATPVQVTVNATFPVNNRTHVNAYVR